MIHVIGDSHSSFFTGIHGYVPVPPPSFYQKWWGAKVETECALPYFKVYHIGPYLAYHMIDSKDNKEKFFYLLDNEDIPKGSKLLLSFGEIDCRAHLYKQFKLQNIPMANVVEDCVTRYVRFLNEISSLGYDVWAWGPVAQNYNEEMADFKCDYGPWTNSGNHIERNNITKLFNKFLEFKYSKSINILELLIDEDGNTKKEYYQDYIHLGQKAIEYTINKMKKVGLINENSPL